MDDAKIVTITGCGDDCASVILNDKDVSPVKNISADVIVKTYNLNPLDAVRLDEDGEKAVDVLKKYIIYDEAQMKASGQLEGTDFATFQSQNNEPTVICPECGVPVPASMERCPYCGIRMPRGCKMLVLRIVAAIVVAITAIVLLVTLL